MCSSYAVDEHGRVGRHARRSSAASAAARRATPARPSCRRGPTRPCGVAARARQSGARTPRASPRPSGRRLSSCVPPVIRWMCASLKPGIRNRPPRVAPPACSGPRSASTSAFDPDGDDAVARDRHRLRLGPGRVHRPHPGVEDDQVGPGFWDRSEPHDRLPAAAHIMIATPAAPRTPPQPLSMESLARCQRNSVTPNSARLCASPVRRADYNPRRRITMRIRAALAVLGLVLAFPAFSAAQRAGAGAGRHGRLAERDRVAGRAPRCCGTGGNADRRGRRDRVRARGHAPDGRQHRRRRLHRLSAGVGRRRRPTTSARWRRRRPRRRCS